MYLEILRRNIIELNNAFLEYQQTKTMPEDKQLAQSMLNMFREFKAMK